MACSVEQSLHRYFQHHEQHRVAVDAKENASCLISGLFGYDQREYLAAEEDEKQCAEAAAEMWVQKQCVSWIL